MVLVDELDNILNLRDTIRLLLTMCFVDLNRNVGFPKEAYGVGASSDPCSDIYKGNKPDSEPETQVIINAVRRLYEAGTDDGMGLKSSIAVHRYDKTGCF